MPIDDAPCRSVIAIRVAGAAPTPATQTALQLLRQAAVSASPQLGQ